MTTGAILGAVLLVGAMVAPLCAQSYPGKPIRFIMPFPRAGRPIFWDASSDRSFPNGSVSRWCLKTVPAPAATSASKLRPRRSPTVTPSFSVRRRSPSAPASTRSSTTIRSRISRRFRWSRRVPIRGSRPSVSPGQEPQGVRGVCQGQSRKTQFRLGRRRASTHLAGEMLKSLAKINIVHVPYKGAAPAMIGLMGGEVDMMVIRHPGGHAADSRPAR